MKKINLVIVCIVAVLIISCKKKTTTEETSNNPPASGPQTFHGFLNSGIDSLFYPSLNVSETGSAYFYEPAVDVAWSGYTKVNAGKVAMNADTLVSTLNDYQLTASTPINISVNDVWAVTGSSVVPAFTFTATGVSPYCDFRKTPDSVSIATGTTFTISVNNFNTGYLVIGTSYIYLSPGINTIALTPSFLSSMPTGITLLKIATENTKTFTIGTKTYKFSKGCSWSKAFKLLP